ncbi:N-acetylneuraminate synthase [Candidatus Magnetomorum sp. HK-1]|nr:N-acetylneuraminate synthase [Candidatus Magnetomorum sp. HK-1]
MINEIKIGHHVIGLNQPIFIIAEAGVNHNGDIELAKRLIHEAKNAGADCIKFQTFKAERLVLDNAPKAEYQKKTTNPSESQLKMLQKLELNEKAHKELFDYCQKTGITFLSTPYNKKDVDLLDQLGVQAFKLSSLHIVEPEFIKYVTDKAKPILMSTGMATLAEVDEAVGTIRSVRDDDEFILLQCTTNYPSLPEHANLRAMKTMENAFNVNVGYSDHTQSHTACIVAIALGAKIIEKHFTLDKNLEGPDHLSSETPETFKQLVSIIRETEQILGHGRKEPVNIEMLNAKDVRRSIVTAKKIQKGNVITKDCIEFKRPAKGISPKLLNQLLGRKVRKDIKENTILDWADLQ